MDWEKLQLLLASLAEQVTFTDPEGMNDPVLFPDMGYGKEPIEPATSELLRKSKGLGIASILGGLFLPVPGMGKASGAKQLRRLLRGGRGMKAERGGAPPWSDVESGTVYHSTEPIDIAVHDADNVEVGRYLTPGDRLPEIEFWRSGYSDANPHRAFGDVSKAAIRHLEDIDPTGIQATANDYNKSMPLYRRLFDRLQQIRGGKGTEERHSTLKYRGYYMPNPARAIPHTTGPDPARSIFRRGAITGDKRDIQMAQDYWDMQRKGRPSARLTGSEAPVNVLSGSGVVHSMPGPRPAGLLPPPRPGSKLWASELFARGVEEGDPAKIRSAQASWDLGQRGGVPPTGPILTEAPVNVLPSSYKVHEMPSRFPWLRISDPQQAKLNRGPEPSLLDKIKESMQEIADDPGRADVRDMRAAAAKLGMTSNRPGLRQAYLDFIEERRKAVLRIREEEEAKRLVSTGAKRPTLSLSTGGKKSLSDFIVAADNLADKEDAGMLMVDELERLLEMAWGDEAAIGYLRSRGLMDIAGDAGILERIRSRKGKLSPTT